MSIASLETKLNRLKAEKKKLENRKSGVEKVTTKLDRKPVDDVDDIKKSGTKAADNLEKSIEGVKGIVTAANEIRSSAQKGHKLEQWEERNYFKKEINRLKSEITRIDGEIAQVKAQIQAEKEAARKAQLAKLLGTQ